MIALLAALLLVVVCPLLVLCLSYQEVVQENRPYEDDLK